jgi:hypothetical protein
LSLRDQEVSSLVNAAADFIRTRFGEDKARAWQCEALPRQQLLIGLKRLAKDAKLDTAVIAAIGDMEVVSLGQNRIRVQLPAIVSAGYSAAGRGADLKARMHETVQRIGLEFTDAPIVSSQKADPDEGFGEAAQADLPPINILILVSTGRRSQDVVRQVSGSDWLPDWIDARREVAIDIEFDGQRLPARRESIQGGLGTNQMPPTLGANYDVVVLLADDEDFGMMLRRYSDLLAVQSRSVFLLAPALPEHAPSEMLIGGDAFPGAGSEFPDFRFDAIIDTSVARSPFWTGNPRRALNSRIADTVVGAALLCCGERSLLTASKKSQIMRVPLLTFAFVGQEMRDAELGLASETAGNPDNTSRSKIYFEARTTRLTRKAKLRGVVELRERISNFVDFAAVIMHSIVGADRFTMPDAVPLELRRHFKFPELCAGFRQRGPFKGMAICAETPTIELLRAAGALGWAVIRYTDQQTIKDVTGRAFRLRPPLLPREIEPIPSTKRPENRGLATRGIDPRDVIRLNMEDRISVESDRSSALRREIRRYIAAPSKIFGRAPAIDADVEFVLPRRVVKYAIDANDDTAKRLLRRLKRMDMPLSSPEKRPADLRMAWSSPQDGTSRFIIVDGAIPGELRRLAPDEVPSQRFFIIDGDSAVPALFGSRLFAAWAQLTLTRSTSWMPRFSVGRTFETFPIREPFVVARIADGAPQLRLQRAKGKYGELVSLIAKLGEGNRKLSFGDRPELRSQIDGLLLVNMGLEPEATDFEIIECLLAGVG